MHQNYLIGIIGRAYGDGNVTRVGETLNRKANVTANTHNFGIRRRIYG